MKQPEFIGSVQLSQKGKIQSKDERSSQIIFINFLKKQYTQNKNKKPKPFRSNTDLHFATVC